MSGGAETALLGLGMLDPLPPVAWVSPLLAATAVFLLLSPGVRPASSGRWGVRFRAPLLALGPVALAVLVAGSSPRVVVLGVVLGGAGLAGRAVWRRRAARMAATRTSMWVLETCEQLAGDLAAGQPPGTALDRAARTWAPLGPVAESFRVGSDVSLAFRAVAGQPGAGDLRLVGAAWQVAHRTGQGLADSVDRVALGLRQAQATRRIVQGELASARSTARLVGGLPVLALLMGSGAGGDPWGFLLGQPVGLACLAGGLTFGLAGLAWIEAIARDVDTAG